MLEVKKEKNSHIALNHQSEAFVKPFIRWAGGKQNLVKFLANNLPLEPINTYFEPFLGAGSLYLASNFPKAKLSDINPHLINSYNSVKNSAAEVSQRLDFYKKKLSKEYYYKLREKFNKERNPFTIDQAAIFIFLVHTSFNGIFRVNRKGEYNVPFGKAKPALPTFTHLEKIQKKLQNTVV